jgi:hypothetical protein
MKKGWALCGKLWICSVSGPPTIASIFVFLK